MILEPKLVVTNTADCTSTGDKASYTVPAGVHAEVIGFGGQEVDGGASGATVALLLTPNGGTAITIATETATDVLQTGGERIALGPGDKIEWNCTIAADPATWHLWISLLIYVAA